MITNLGRKRTYVQAGLEADNAKADETVIHDVQVDVLAIAEGVFAGVSSEAPKKKRKRSRGKKSSNVQTTGDSTEPPTVPVDNDENGNSTIESKVAKGKKKSEKKRAKGKYGPHIPNQLLLYISI